MHDSPVHSCTAIMVSCLWARRRCKERADWLVRLAAGGPCPAPRHSAVGGGRSAGWVPQAERALLTVPRSQLLCCTERAFAMRASSPRVSPRLARPLGRAGLPLLVVLAGKPRDGSWFANMAGGLFLLAGRWCRPTPAPLGGPAAARLQPTPALQPMTPLLPQLCLQRPWRSASPRRTCRGRCALTAAPPSKRPSAPLPRLRRTRCAPPCWTAPLAPAAWAL